MVAKKLLLEMSKIQADLALNNLQFQILIGPSFREIVPMDYSDSGLSHDCAATFLQIFYGISPRRQECSFDHSLY